jgi:hypothetical protein
MLIFTQSYTSDGQLLKNSHNELSLPKMNFHFRFILGQPDCATRRKRFSELAAVKNYHNELSQ